jgi:hypothetical protein
MKWKQFALILLCAIGTVLESTLLNPKCTHD